MASEYIGGELPTILCCLCGVVISPNPSNMCVNCIRSSIDITECIARQHTIHSCRSCGRFLCPPWQKVELESKELMAACLRKIPGLNKVKLVDAVWIWTEPHSMRLKIKLTVQKEITNGAILQQAVVVEFVIRNQQCKDCEKSYAQGVWHAVAQVRQRVPHKRTFLYLEQVMLKYNAHSDCINIVTFRDGMDFFFMEKQQCLKFIDFLSGHVPLQDKYSRKLVSADKKNGIAEYKNNFLVELAPICKDDLVILPKELAHNLSNISPLVLIKSVSSGIHIVDPLSGERQEINNEKFWRNSFTSLMNSRQLSRYIVLSIEPLLRSSRPSARKRGADKKLHMAEVVVAKENEMGQKDAQYTCTTHLGHILKVGDTVLGYDLTNSSWTQQNDYQDVLKKDLPDVILVRKYRFTKGERFWALKSLEQEGLRMNLDANDEGDMAVDGSGGQGNNISSVSAGHSNRKHDDYEEFLQELEGDREMRAHVNLYRSDKSMKHRKKANELDDDNNMGDTAIEEETREEEEQDRSKSTSRKERRKARKIARAGAASSGLMGLDDNPDEEDMEDRRGNSTSSKPNRSVAMNRFAYGEDDDDDEDAIRMEELLDDLAVSFAALGDRETKVLSSEEAKLQSSVEF